MTRISPIIPLLLLTLLLADSAAAQEAAPTPQLLMHTSILTLEARDYVSAKLRHEVHLFGKHLFGTGIYKEQRPGRDFLMRVELKFPLADHSCSLVQVCDGRYFWEYRNFPSEAKLARTDIVRVIRGLDQANRLPTQPQQPILPGIGGLTRVLHGLSASFDFDSVEAGTWGAQKQLVWRMRGTWKREILPRLLPEQQAAISRGDAPNFSKLPDYLPDQVVLLLGQDDLFPYRIEYRRTQSAKEGPAEEPTSTCLVLVDFTEVDISTPIDRRQFIYQPPSDIEFSDQTDGFMQGLGLKP